MTSNEFGTGPASGGYGTDGSDTYDVAGNVVSNSVSAAPPDWRSWKFDAAGRMTDWLETTMYAGVTRWDQGETLTFDGDGRTAKRLKRKRTWASPPSGWYEEPEYYIYSFASLEQAFTERDFQLMSLKVEPGYDPLRDNPRFQDLTRRVGFP